MAPDFQLFSPFRLRSVTLRNRTMIAPMCMYQVEDGMVGDFHLVHLGRFALGGAGLVFAEATAVSPTGRITLGCPGLWKDGQIAGFRRITDQLHAQGAAAGIQLAHAGPKASARKPWQGGAPLEAEEGAWQSVSASPTPCEPGWPSPRALDEEGMAAIIREYSDATVRADHAGFDVVEVHAAHGYLLHSFLSPLSNDRTDDHGGDIDGRMRFPLAVVRAVREVWPREKPLFVRISSVDGIDIGWSVEDSVVFSRALKAIGVDAIDCSSGGMAIPPDRRLVQRVPGFHVHFAETIRREVDIPTVAVGLIRDPHHAEIILQSGQADLVAIAREALFRPNWPLEAALELEGGRAWDKWPVEYGLRLMLRARQQGELFGPDAIVPNGPEGNDPLA